MENKKPMTEEEIFQAWYNRRPAPAPHVNPFAKYDQHLAEHAALVESIALCTPGACYREMMQENRNH